MKEWSMDQTEDGSCREGCLVADHADTHSGMDRTRMLISSKSNILIRIRIWLWHQKPDHAVV